MRGPRHGSAPWWSGGGVHDDVAGNAGAPLGDCRAGRRGRRHRAPARWGEGHSSHMRADVVATCIQHPGAAVSPRRAPGAGGRHRLGPAFTGTAGPVTQQVVRSGARSHADAGSDAVSHAGTPSWRRGRFHYSVDTNRMVEECSGAGAVSRVTRDLGTAALPPEQGVCGNGSAAGGRRPETEEVADVSARVAGVRRRRRRTSRTCGRPRWPGPGSRSVNSRCPPPTRERVSESMSASTAMRPRSRSSAR